MQNEYSIVITTAGSLDSAKAIARLLVEKKLAACVQLFPVESFYFWKNEICDDSEITLFIKSKTALFEEIKAVIKENHEYELPEIIQIPVANGFPEYFSWINDCTNR
ncbi:MAG: divalent-cation tolerance protein CutA [Treponema sp.]|nr:divalent-cation tolerance protein CutA [Treponema sp.]MCL2273207.1 divalent-cation tolerance protein CutA [Treponema sp.]